MEGFKVLVLFIIFFGLLQTNYAQPFKAMTLDEKKNIQISEDTLATLARGILISEISENRMYACHQFIPALVRALKINNSFEYKFPRLENISIQYPEDSLFRIFTWQLQVNDGEYKYFGAIQFNQPVLKLIALSDRSDKMINPEVLTNSADQWYGLVYYGVKTFQLSNKEKGYLLFGYDGYDVYDHRKVIDILSFNDGSPVFGLPIFRYDKNNVKNRIIYQYSADAGVRVNYDEKEGMVVCDHLISNPGNLPGQGKTMVPEGSYEGFKLEKGIWKYINEVFPSNNAANQKAYATKPIKAVEKKSAKNN